MAVVSNVNRKATAEAVVQSVALLKRIVGLSIQTHRAFESPGREGKGRTQQDVASQANTQQSVVSKLENGKLIPANKLLSNILREAGYNMAGPGGGTALLRILQAIRDNEANLKKTVKEQPS